VPTPKKNSPVKSSRALPNGQNEVTLMCLVHNVSQPEQIQNCFSVSREDGPDRTKSSADSSSCKSEHVKKYAPEKHATMLYYLRFLLIFLSLLKQFLAAVDAQISSVI